LPADLVELPFPENLEAIDALLTPRLGIGLAPADGDSRDA
jgi:hypothetical protein